MASLSNVPSLISRIVIGYIIACFVAALGLFLVGAVMSVGDPPVEGRTAIGDLANQAGYFPVYAAFAAVFAAPVAALGIAVSEVAKLDKLWYFLVLGALSAIPVLFTGKDRSISEMLEGFAMFGPIGAIAAGAFWLVRHRKWPI